MFELSRQLIGSSHVPAWNWDAHRRRGNGNLSSGITNTWPRKGIKKKEGKKRARTNVCKFRVKGPWPRARNRTSTFVAVIYNNIYKILDTFIIIMKKNTFDLKKKKKKERRWNLWVFFILQCEIHVTSTDFYAHSSSLHISTSMDAFCTCIFFYIQPQ